MKTSISESKLMSKSNTVMSAVSAFSSEAMSFAICSVPPVALK